MTDAALAYLANLAAFLAAATALALAAFNVFAKDEFYNFAFFSRALYAAIAFYAFLADFSAFFESFADLIDALLAYLASLTESLAFLADSEAAFLRLFALETDFLAILANFLAAFLAAFVYLAILVTFALHSA